MFIFKYILAEVNKIRQKLFKKYENSKKKRVLIILYSYFIIIRIFDNRQKIFISIFSVFTVNYELLLLLLKITIHVKYIKAIAFFSFSFPVMSVRK